jgi:hypothetical protein
MVPLYAVTGISTIVVTAGSRFGIIGMAVTVIVTDAKGSKVAVGMGLPGFLPVWILINHINPVKPETSTTKPSKNGRRNRFSIGIPDNHVFAWPPLISGGNGPISLRIKTGQRVCRRPFRQTRRWYSRFGEASGLA